MADRGARLPVRRPDGIAGERQSPAIGAGKFPQCRGGTGLLALGHNAAARIAVPRRTIYVSHDPCLHEPASFPVLGSLGAGSTGFQYTASDGRDGGPAEFSAGGRVRTFVAGRAFSLRS